jgi:hypothetical protein
LVRLVFGAAGGGFEGPVFKGRAVGINVPIGSFASIRRPRCI